MTTLTLIPTSTINTTMIVLIILFSIIGLGFCYFPHKNETIKKILTKIGYMFFIFVFFLCNVMVYYMFQLTESDNFGSVSRALLVFMTCGSILLTFVLLAIIFMIVKDSIIGVVEDGFKNKDS